MKSAPAVPVASSLRARVRAFVGSLVCSLVWACVTVPALSGCFDLDSFVWNPDHCSTITKQLCDDKNLCAACGEDFDFAKFGIPPEAATRHTITLEDGETNDSWFFAAQGGGPLSELTIVFSHGNRGGLEHYLNRVALLLLSGANVYGIDYRGFGQSSTTAEPTEIQFLADTHVTRAGIPAILASHGVSATGIVLMAYSAGALAGIEMGVSADSCGLILEAPWPSIDGFSRDGTFIGVPGSFLTTGRWDNLSKMKSYFHPYLHFHGTIDDTVHIDLGREMFANSPSSQKVFVAVPGADHGNFLGKPGDVPDVAETLGPEAYNALVVEFMAGLDCR